MRKKTVEHSEKTKQAEVLRETRQAYMGRLRSPTPKGRGRISDPDESSVFTLPEFRTQEEFDAWWDALPKVKAEVDPRLKERIKTSIRLSRRTIDGFDFLAKKKGIRSGQTLMKVVLESYLSKSLPPDF